MKKTQDNIVAVIMAGGYGERFWPKSRRACPKQFMDISGRGESIIEETWRRVEKFLGADRIYVVTHESQAALVRKHLPKIKRSNILAEPISRNTAPCIAWAAYTAKKTYGDPVMIVLPSDHYVGDQSAYIEDLRTACRFAREGEYLLTFGITPTSPETGYGYIERGEDLEDRICRVKQFKEKPNLETAKRFLSEGRYCWNSGMFVFRAQVVLDAIEDCDPELFGMLKPLQKAPTNKTLVRRVYKNCKKISIDYAVMEKSGKVCIVTARFAWNDIGSWASVYDLSRKDEFAVVRLGPGLKVTSGARNCMIFSDGGLVAVNGVEDVIVVKDKDAVLVARLSEAQRVREVVDEIRKNPKASKYI